MVSSLRLAMGRSRRKIERLYGNLAVQDVGCLAYHGSMLARVALAPNRVAAQHALPALLMLFMTTLFTIVVVRGELLPAGRARAVLYRVGVVLPMLIAYAPLRHALPLLSGALRDAALLRIDTLLFGATPAVLLERFVSATSVEWFAFFYYSYFTMVFLYVIGSSFLDRGRRAAEVMFGAVTICGIGHTLYTLVPGVGPHAAMHFAVPLSGGLFYKLVLHTVSVSGANLDIFPSLHTAYPTLFTLHALRHRHTLPYRYAALPTAFFTVNIIIATLFLRWHYAIDVIVGLVLAAVAQRLGIISAAYESDETRGARQAVWESLR